MSSPLGPDPKESLPPHALPRSNGEALIPCIKSEKLEGTAGCQRPGVAGMAGLEEDAQR